MAAETATAPAPPAPPAPAAPVAASRKPRTPKKEASAPTAKDAGSKKGRKASKSAGEAQSNANGPSVAAHPRAARAVARAKGWGGLAGFVLGGYLSLPTNTIAAAALRALLAGIVCYVVAWAGAVFLWRRLVMLEIKAREQQLLASAEAAVGARGAGRESPPTPAESSARAAS